MSTLFSSRIDGAKSTFVQDILKAGVNPNTISFAGGLPNPASFPVKELEKACEKVLEEDGVNALQYNTTEGCLPLRQKIAARYKKRFGLNISPEEILITNGSQQALDLLGKVFLDKGNCVMLEKPAYLGAIQAFRLYEPSFCEVPFLQDGVDLDALEEALKNNHPKFFYAVTNFQNPSGLTYSKENRRKAAKVMEKHGTIFVEDDPYGELRFFGEEVPSMKCFYPENTILLGSFSKIVSPGLRMGWIVARPDIMDPLLTAKQASDVHSNYFVQKVLDRYLQDNDLDSHIEKIRAMYKKQSTYMTEMIDRYFPKEVECTRPEGGMFLWVTLPEGMSSVELFKIAAQANVAFVPGDPFYIDEHDTNTLRLNYTNSDDRAIEQGIKSLGGAIRELMERKK